MPSFADTTRTTASPEEVWTLLHDPARLSDWWAGAGEVDGHPLPQVLEAARDGGRVVIFCESSGVRLEWRLEPGGSGTRIDVLVDVPEKDAAQLAEQRDLVRRSLLRLGQPAPAQL